MSLRLKTLTVLSLLCVMGCASTPEPILSIAPPQETGTPAASPSYIEACRAEAEAAGIDPSSSDGGITVPNIVNRTAGNAAIGGATGSSIGAPSGALWAALSEVL